MSDQLTPGPHHRESEFRVPGQYGTCGPCALAMACWNATGKPTHTENVYALMRAHGLCDVSGASTPGALKTAAQLLGLNVVDFMGYGGDTWSGWPSFLGRHAGHAATVLELSEGWALVDAVSGKGENAITDPNNPKRLHYHYICVYGSGTRNGVAGVWAADGDNWAAGDVLQFYPFTTLAKAQPCAALAILVPDGGSTVNIPSGWHDDGKTLTAPKPDDHPITLGFRDHILADPQWNPHNVPLNQAYGANVAGESGTMQDFRDAALMWNAKQGVWSHPYGPDVIDLRSQLDSANETIAQLKAQLASAGSGSGSADPTATAAIEALMAAFAAHSKAS